MFFATISILVFWGVLEFFFVANPRVSKLFSKVGINFYGKSMLKDSKICSCRVDWSTFDLRPHPTVDLGQCKFENHWKPGLSRPGHPIVQFTVDLGP